MRRTIRVVVLLAVLAVIASACGARVGEDEIRAAGNRGGGGGQLASGDGSGDGSTDTTLSVGEGDGSTATTTAGGSGGSGGGGEATAPSAPQGGNGGATDIGVTADSIVFGNVSTLSGPVPGLFKGAVVGAQAVINYQNSKGGMFGRKFKLDVRDDQFDTGQNRAQTTELLGKTFAFLGSFSLYDDAAAEAITKSGIPDVSYSLSGIRRGVPNNFSVQPAVDGGAPTSGFLWFRNKFPEAVKAVGTIYGDVPASKASHVAYKAAAESVGFNYIYERGVAPTETDYTADVIRMKGQGVKMVFLIATDDKTTARLLKSMAQQAFKPEVVSANYMPTLPDLAGATAEGVYGPTGSALYGGEDAGTIPEVGLMNQWVQKVAPGYKSDVFSTYAWASGRLLFQAMEAAGPQATRAKVIAELRKIDKFTANNLLAEAGPATKRPSTCMVMSQIKNGKYVRIDPTNGFFCLGPYHRG